MVKRIVVLVAALALTTTSLALGADGGPGFWGGRPHFAWHLTPTGTTARLRGLSAVSANVAWTSGSLGTVLRTIDRGTTWQSVGPPGTDSLQFRDVEAFDADHAVILSIGEGTDSRIYVTSDAGQHWTLGFMNDDPNAFYDCMDFFDRDHGLALSDPVNGRFRIIATSDGGQSWHVVAADMPPALPGEFAFAASGQCLRTGPGNRAWFATGGGAEARVFRSDNGGQTWQVFTTPIQSGPSAGIFALAFRDALGGIAAGGDFLTPANSPNAMAVTSDGGATWHLAAAPPNEYRSGATWMDGRVAIVVGPTGSDFSLDLGETWTRFDNGSFDTVDCAPGGACWASGEQGRAAYLVRLL